MSDAFRRLGAAVPPALAAGMVAGMVPGGREMLAAQAALERLKLEIHAFARYAHLGAVDRVRLSSEGRGRLGWHASVTIFWRERVVPTLPPLDPSVLDGEGKVEVTRSRILATVNIAKNDEVLALEALRFTLAIGGGELG